MFVSGTDRVVGPSDHVMMSDEVLVFERAWDGDSEFSILGGFVSRLVQYGQSFVSGC